jgi:hypothetical protein
MIMPAFNAATLTLAISPFAFVSLRQLFKSKGGAGQTHGKPRA